MTMLEVHNEALDSTNAIFHEFLLCYKAYTKKVYGIVEGKEDVTYYNGLISQIIPDDWDIEFIIAGCKNKVIKSIETFDWTRFPLHQICFFVDRDLSDFFPGNVNHFENLYITDYYSIENNIVNFYSIKRLIGEVFNITGLRPNELSEIQRRFDDGLRLFCEAMTSIMIQVIYWRRIGLSPCLDNIRPKEFFDFNNGIINLKAQFITSAARLEHAATCLKYPTVNIPDLKNIEVEFRKNQGPEKFIRGKYLIWYFSEFVLNIHRSLTNILPRFTSLTKLRVTVGANNIIIFVAPRVKCPESLKDFLGRTYVRYISKRANIV